MTTQKVLPHKRIYNANLKFDCSRCSRRFPRMYQEEGGAIVCNPTHCRDRRHPRVVTEPIPVESVTQYRLECPICAEVTPFAEAMVSYGLIATHVEGEHPGFKVEKVGNDFAWVKEVIADGIETTDPGNAEPTGG